MHVSAFPKDTPRPKKPRRCRRCRRTGEVCYQCGEPIDAHDLLCDCSETATCPSCWGLGEIRPCP